MCSCRFDESICQLRGVLSVLFLSFSFFVFSFFAESSVFNANSVDRGQMLHNAASVLVLYCLPRFCPF